MYIREGQAVRDLDTLHPFLRANPFGVLTTAIPHPTIDTLQSTHIPWVLDEIDEPAPRAKDVLDVSAVSAKPPGPNAKLGRLRGHMARANPQAKALISAVPDSPGVLEQDVLILFTHDNHAYVSPRWMSESRGLVAPTWNFAAVQVYGRAKIFHSPKDGETLPWLEELLGDLAAQSEASVPVDGPVCPVTAASEKLDTKTWGGPDVVDTRDWGTREWGLDDTTRTYIDPLKKRIIGIEVEITKIEGRFKMGQDESAEDWVSILHQFESLGTEAGTEMGQLIRERDPKREKDWETGVIGEGCPVKAK